MKKDPFTLFWYWINERQKIYVKKKRGDKFPWTKDYILRTYKFCNVYRMLDTETINLHARLKKKPAVDILFNIILFRGFNWTATYDLLGGWQSHNAFDSARAKVLLHRAKRAGEKIFTGAYMISNAASHKSKIDLMVDAMQVAADKTEENLARIKAIKTMEGAVAILKELPMVGSFVAYEFACDLRYTSILHKAKDVHTWANPGPGAKRGINRLLGRPYDGPSLRPDELQEEMKALLKMAPHKLSKWHKGRTFEMREIEHSLCEFDKYSRVINDQGRPRSKYHVA